MGTQARLLIMATRSNAQFLAASVTEFMTVWSMSGEASLNLSTIGGITTIGFNCTLGKPGAPHLLPPSTPSHPSSSPSRKPRHRGPAEKERNRLRAARHQAAQTAGNASSDPDKSSPLDTSESITSPTPVPVPVTDSSEVNIDLVEQTDSEKTFENVPICLEFSCDLCNYKNATEKGLRQHTRMKHRISQVDGIADLSLDEPSIKQIEAKETQTDVFLQTDEKGYLTGPDMDALYDEPPPTVYHPLGCRNLPLNTYTYQSLLLQV